MEGVVANEPLHFMCQEICSQPVVTNTAVIDYAWRTLDLHFTYSILCAQGQIQEQKLGGGRLNYTVCSTSIHLEAFSLSFILKKLKGMLQEVSMGLVGVGGTRDTPAPTLDPPLSVHISMWSNMRMHPICAWLGCHVNVLHFCLLHGLKKTAHRS